MKNNRKKIIENKEAWIAFKLVFPEKLKIARLNREWSQIELAKKCGLSNQSIWACENCFTTGDFREGMRISNIVRIFEVLPELEKDFTENYIGGHISQSD